MPRTIVDIPDEQLRDIDSLCRLLGIKSRAEIVRLALREFLKSNDQMNVDGFGLWQKQKASSTARTRVAR